MARFVKTQFDKTAHTITWTVGTEAPVVLHLDKVSAGNKEHAMYHGFNQRCSDNAADEKTAGGKRAAIALMAEFYEAGGEAWDRERKGGGVAKFDSGAVIAAMARVLFQGNIDKANHAADATAGKRNISRDDALKLYATDERIAADIARAKAAAIPAKVDADSLLADMEEEGDEEEVLNDEAP